MSRPPTTVSAAPAPASPSAVRVEVLGPLRVTVDGRPVDVPGTKRRTVLAVLALAEGGTVSIAELADAVADDDSLDHRAAIQNHVSRLRRDLGPGSGRLVTDPGGYRLALDAGFDLIEARRALERADGAAGEAAFTELRGALELWRGEVLAELAGVAAIDAAVAAATRLRDLISDALVDRAIACGRADEVLDVAAASVAAEPLREGAVTMLARALAAAGRTADALRATHDFRRRLVGQTGLDPTPSLASLDGQIASGALTASAAVDATDRVPPLASTTARLIGRSVEVEQVRSWLADERLVTVVGPGGVGKTRLVAEVIAGRDDVAVLPLAPVSGASSVPHVVADALHVTVARGDVLAACAAFVAERPIVLVVDNCEHLVEAAAETIGRLIAACPALRVLATSREPLGLPEERVLRLRPLGLPEGDDPTAGSDATSLFLERAERIRTTDWTRGELAVVAEIVRRLDGLPLAIELAAGRLSALSPADLLDRLDRSLDLLAGRPTDHRHRTLRATLDWSDRLLTDADRRLLQHLAAFPDGVDLTTAEWVASDLGLDGDPVAILGRLVDASLLDLDRGEADGPTRYRMLETVRLYGRDRLEAVGEAEIAGERLVRWAAELATRLGAAMATVDEAAADAHLRRELPNLRAAWQQATGGAGHGRADREAQVAIVVGLFDVIAYRDLVEIRGWARALADDPAIGDDLRVAAVLGAAAEAAYHDGDLGRAEQLARRGLDAGGAADDVDLARLAMASVALARGEFDVAVAHARAAEGGRAGECQGVGALALAFAGDLDRARRRNREAYATAASSTRRAWEAYIDAEIDQLAGETEAAEDRYRRSITLARASGATFVEGVAAVGLLSVQAASGRTTDALLGYREIVDRFADTGNWTHLWVTLGNLGRFLRALGDATGADLVEAAETALADPDRLAAVLGHREALRRARSAVARHLATGSTRP